MNYKDIIKLYGFHDTDINEVKRNNSSIILIFNSGIYNINDKGKETDKSTKCQLVLDVNKISGEIENHLEINEIRKGKIRELKFNKFVDLLKNDEFRIEMDYYSEFAKSLFLKGFVGKSQINFILSDIENISLEFV